MDREELHDRLQRTAAWLDASPAEVAGLGVLLVGVVALAASLWWWSSPRPDGPGPADGAPPVVAPSGGADPTSAPSAVTLHVAGAVVAPGLVTVMSGARVADAIAAAGGATGDAALDGLNLARPVTDGERLEVPRLGEPAGASTPGTEADGGTGARRPDGTLDLNLATAADLEELPGIGPVLAERIVAWRDEHGRFASVGQLREVSGIGEKTFQQLSSLVAV